MKIKTTIKEFLNEQNLTDVFMVDDIISYNYKHTAKVIKVHDGGDLLDVVLFHPKAGVVTTPTTVATSLCVKFKQL